MRYIARNGARPSKKAEINTYITYDQLVDILQIIGSDRENPNRRRDHAMFYLGYYLGLRATEIGHLERQDFRHISAGEVSIKTLKRRGEVRVVTKYLERFVREYAKKYIAGMREDQQWLLERAPGLPLERVHVAAIFGHYAQQAGLDRELTPHSLRHGRGVTVWQKTHDLLMVKNYLRHSSIKSSEKYIHLDPKAGERMVEAMERDED